MRYQSLGKTGSQVSLIGLGCARFGGIFASESKIEYVQLIHQAIAEGITLFDTADMYTQGESEQILGDALRGHRQSVLISTKVGYCLPPQRYVASALKPLLRPVLQALHLRRMSLPTALRGLPTQNFSPTYIISAAEQCLRRLQTDYIDLLLLHSPPSAVLASGEFLEPLGKLRAQGKVCHFGVSCESTADAYICLRYPQLSTLQIRVNLLDQSAVTDFLPQAFARGLAIIARECFAGGILAKLPSERHLDRRIIDPEERAIRSRQLELLDQFAARIGRSVPELALQFVIGLSGVNTALLGMRSSVQMLQNRALWQADPLSPAEYQQLTTLLIEPN